MPAMGFSPSPGASVPKLPLSADKYASPDSAGVEESKTADGLPPPPPPPPVSRPPSAGMSMPVAAGIVDMAARTFRTPRKGRKPTSWLQDKDLKNRVSVYFNRMRILPALSDTLMALHQVEAERVQASVSLCSLLQQLVESAGANVTLFLWGQHPAPKRTSGDEEAAAAADRAAADTAAHAASTQDGGDGGGDGNEEQGDGDQHQGGGQGHDDAGQGHDQGAGAAAGHGNGAAAAAATAAAAEAQPTCVVSALTVYLERLADGAVSGTRAYGNMYGSARLFRAICSSKVSRAASLRSVLSALQEAIHGSSVGEVASSGFAARGAITVKLSETAAADFMDRRRAMLLRLWYAAVRALDYVTEELSIVEKIMTKKARVDKRWASQLRALQVAVLTTEKAALELSNSVLYELFDLIETAPATVDSAAAGGGGGGGKKAASAARQKKALRATKSAIVRVLGKEGRVHRMLDRLRQYTGMSNSKDRNLDRPLDSYARLRRSPNLVASIVALPSREGEWRKFYALSAPAESARFGFGFSRVSLRRLVDQLVFGYYSVLNRVTPRHLRLEFGDDLPSIEAYRGRIELNRNGRLEVVTFPTPLAVRKSITNSHVQDSIKELKHNPEITRDFHANKLRDFVRHADSVLNVIKQQDTLATLSVVPRDDPTCCSTLGRYRAKLEHFVARNAHVWYYMAVTLAVAINVLLLVDADVDAVTSVNCPGGVPVADLPVDCENGMFRWAGQAWDPNATSRQSALGLSLGPGVAFTVRILSLVHLFLACSMLYAWLAVPGRVFLNKLRSANVYRSHIEVPSSEYKSEFTVEKITQTTAISTAGLYFQLLLNPALLGHVAYLVIGLCGLLVSPAFAAVELFAFAKRVKIFNEVMYSVVKNPGRLLSTVALGVIGVWAFTLIGQVRVVPVPVPVPFLCSLFSFVLLLLLLLLLLFFSCSITVNTPSRTSKTAT